MPKPTQSQLDAMRKLGMSDEEIADVIASDDAIDKGKKVSFDLTDEQAKEAKKYTKAGTRTAYKLDNTQGKRSRKENATKAGIIAELATFLTENSEFSTENVEITNKERQILFKIGDETFELTLIQKRKPKN